VWALYPGRLLSERVAAFPDDLKTAFEWRAGRAVLVCAALLAGDRFIAPGDYWAVRNVGFAADRLNRLLAPSGCDRWPELTQGRRPSDLPVTDVLKTSRCSSAWAFQKNP
jgi:hypothetical protein